MLATFYEMPSTPHPKIASGQIGAIVERYRLLKELTQKELADKAKITQGYLSKIESGTATWLRVDKVERLADALDIPREKLKDASQISSEIAIQDLLTLESGRSFPIRARPGDPTRKLEITPEVAAFLEQFARLQESGKKAGLNRNQLSTRGLQMAGLLRQDRWHCQR